MPSLSLPSLFYLTKGGYDTGSLIQTMHVDEQPRGVLALPNHRWPEIPNRKSTFCNGTLLFVTETDDLRLIKAIHLQVAQIVKQENSNLALVSWLQANPYLSPGPIKAVNPYL
jgi:hypothetical protein